MMRNFLTGMLPVVAMGALLLQLAGCAVSAQKADPTEQVQIPQYQPVESTMLPEPAVTEQPEETYPPLRSSSGAYQDCGSGVIRVDNSAFELYDYVDSQAQRYADAVNTVALGLKGVADVYCMTIPTGIGIVLPDDIAGSLPGYVDQGEVISRIHEKLGDFVIPVNCYDNLMDHRDEYLYFRTDYHWNGLGAYYAYEAFCREKGVEVYTLDQRKELRFDGFRGAFCGTVPSLAQEPDTVIAYCPVSESASMRYTDRNGNTYDWNIVMDVSNWSAASKYSTFAAGDNPIAVFTNPEADPESVCIVVKESYGNALLPYLVDHYGVIYELDYRYWQGELVSFAKETGADDLLFANNLSMIRSDYLVGLLAQKAK